MAGRMVTLDRKEETLRLRHGEHYADGCDCGHARSYHKVWRSVASWGWGECGRRSCGCARFRMVDGIKEKT